jgi:hypothetical protein
MPKLPWTARQDSPPAEEASLDALLAGNGLPAGADAELWPVADMLAALAARPVGGELTGLTAARAEFRRVAAPAQATPSRRGRSFGLVSRLGVRAAAAAAVVAMGMGGAAAVAYAGALPASWQQFAHRTIGAPAHGPGPGPGTRAVIGAPHPAPHPDSSSPAHHAHSRKPPGRHRHHTRPPVHAVSPTARPFMHRLWPLPALPGGHRPPTTLRPAPRPAPTEQMTPDPIVSNAGSPSVVS